MKDEILGKALNTDETVIPRYDIVKPDGTKLVENAELVLKNPVTQEGTPYNKLNVLTDSTAVRVWPNEAERPADPNVDGALGFIADPKFVGYFELQDYDMEIGAFTNAGAGWNTQMFQRAFDGTPVVFSKALEMDGYVCVSGVQADRFLYEAMMNKVQEVTISNSRVSLSLIETTDEPVTIQYLAVYFGGER